MAAQHGESLILSGCKVISKVGVVSSVCVSLGEGWKPWKKFLGDDLKNI